MVRKIIAVLLAATILPATSCTEKPVQGVPAGKYGEKGEISLNLDLKLSGINEKGLVVSKGNAGTRGTAAANVDDRLLEDVNVYVVDELGDLVYHKYCRGDLDFKFEVYENMLYIIYAVANAGKELKVEYAEDIEDLVLSIPDISYIKSGEGAVLMSGKSLPQRLRTGTSVPLYLTRCVAKVCLRGDFSALNSDVDIDVKSVRLKNVPSEISLFGENRIKSSSASMNGDALYNLSSEGLEGGIVFYQFENLQGTLQPENTTQQEKVWPQGSLYSGICSYVEMEAAYSSPRKQGTILYRFYLGKDMFSNYDVPRNTQMNVVVNFIGDGSVDENTWRTDNSEIIDLVTGITVTPQSCTLAGAGETCLLVATVSPETAGNSILAWSSSNNSVAVVDNAGLVTAVGEGECLIYAASTDGTNISGSCSVTVKPQEPELYEISFEDKNRQMYHGQKLLLPFASLSAGNKVVDAISSAPDIVKILGVTEKGVEVEAIVPGIAVISANVGDLAGTECNISVEELKIVPAKESIAAYNHFYTDVEYSISPSFAAQDFNVAITSSAEEIAVGFEGIGNRIIPQYPQSAELPAQSVVTLALEGRPDVVAEVSVDARPMLEMVQSLTINANMGNADAVRSLGLGFHPRAQVMFSWLPADGRKYYGDPGAGNVEIKAGQDKIVFPIPNSANGLYCLAAFVAGDDGYGASGEAGSIKYCEISVYETVYLVGFSKTIDRNKVQGSSDTWEYENEIAAKWLSHPNSLLYPQGELDLELGFKYNGKTYTENYTGESEIFTYTFVKGEQIPMALGTETVIYNGTAPLYYLEYFALEPAGSAYRDGNPATGEPYLYIFSRNFVSGFSKTPAPDWEKIFEIVYP